MKFIRTNAVLALALALSMCTSTLATTASAPEIATEIPELVNPVTTDSHGEVELEDVETLLDFIIPDEINGKTVHTIGAYAFEGCDLFRTVTIPATITEIGEYAFADCPYLEAIILEDRADLEDLSLGYNWNGDAPIVFEETASTSPSKEMLAFEEALEDTEAFEAVDTSNLNDAKSALDALIDTYWDLSDEECTKDIVAAFNDASDTLSQLIEQAEVAVQTPVETPADGQEDPAEGDEIPVIDEEPTEPSESTEPAPSEPQEPQQPEPENPAAPVTETPANEVEAVIEEPVQEEPVFEEPAPAADEPATLTLDSDPVIEEPAPAAAESGGLRLVSDPAEDNNAPVEEDPSQYSGGLTLS